MTTPHRNASTRPDAQDMPPHEARLSEAIDSCQHWIETSSDPAIRAAFRMALHELRALLPDRVDR